jgi:hypothetical protein
MEHYLGRWEKAPWDAGRWPNFTPAEIACPCCGEVYIDEEALDALQKLRNLVGGPLTITSGHRCDGHNGTLKRAAKGSVHLQLAFDIALGPYSRGSLLAFAKEAGFRRFGLMRSALHVDTHPVDQHHAAYWTYGPESRKAWAGLFPAATPDIGG